MAATLIVIVCIFVALCVGWLIIKTMPKVVAWLVFLSGIALVGVHPAFIIIMPLVSLIFFKLAAKLKEDSLRAEWTLRQEKPWNYMD